MLWYVNCALTKHTKKITFYAKTNKVVLPSLTCVFNQQDYQLLQFWIVQPHACAPTDLQCVFNGIWEVLEGTDGDGLLRWVLAGTVWLCEEGDYNLDISFGTQSTGLQQGFTVVNTSPIHVHTCTKHKAQDGA